MRGRDEALFPAKALKSSFHLLIVDILAFVLGEYLFTGHGRRFFVRAAPPGGRRGGCLTALPSFFPAASAAKQDIFERTQD